MMYKCSFFYGMLFAYCISLSSELSKSLSPIQGANIAYVVYDLKENRVLDAHQENTRLAPASTQKLITTALALEVLGKDYTFFSELTYKGVIKHGVLDGDIVFKPNFNPALANERFGYDLTDFINQINIFLTTHKIKEVKGSFVVVDSMYQQETLPRKWLWEDVGNYFGANPTGLILNENILNLYFKTAKVGEEVELVKLAPKVNVRIDNQLVAHHAQFDLAYVFSQPYGDFLQIHGSIPANKILFKVKAALPNPYQVLSEVIQSNFGAVVKSVRIQHQYKDALLHPLIIHEVSLLKVIEAINTHSVNLLAEVVYQTTLKMVNHQVDFKRYFSTAFFPVPSPVLYDGSGLSRFNAVAPMDILSVLLYNQNNTDFIQSLSSNGEKGTLKSWQRLGMKNGIIKAKSGYTEGVRAYAGYIGQTQNRYAFVLMVNNYLHHQKQEVYTLLKNYILDLAQKE